MTEGGSHDWARRSLWLVLFLLLAGLALGTTLDDKADAQYKQALERALVTFGLARALNGVISVAQGTELALEPAGIGVTFTPGQLLDPINDLIERFSWVMLLSSVSLGVQQTLLAMSAWWPLRLIAVSAMAALLVAHWPGRLSGNWRRILARVAVFFLLLRFAMPAIVIVNDLVYRQFLESDYIAATTVIEQTQSEIEAITDDELEVDPGVIESIRSWVDQTAQQIDLRKRMLALKEKLANTTEQLLRLAALFVLQTILLPLATLWLLLKSSQLVSRQLFGSVAHAPQQS